MNITSNILTANVNNAFGLNFNEFSKACDPSDTSLFENLLLASTTCILLILLILYVLIMRTFVPFVIIVYVIFLWLHAQNIIA